jgi:serralysin
LPSPTFGWRRFVWSLSGGNLFRPEMALQRGKSWKKGKKISVSFVGGSERVREGVRHYARIWEQHADISFDFLDAGIGKIRIGFDREKGSKSYVGVDALHIPLDRTTMNYSWLEDNSSDEIFSSVVLHEFGHALGCIHEHQHPGSQIPWDVPVVVDYYARVAGWTEAEVKAYVFDTYAQDMVNGSTYDRDSIMHYAVPEEHTVGDYNVGWNTVLSDGDKSFIAIIY